LKGERQMKRWMQWAGPALLVIVVLGIYWPGLAGGFIFDDYSTIVDNTRLHVETLQPSSIWRAATSFDPGGTLGARPLAMATLALNHVLGGLDPWGYKLGGLLVHAANALLVYLLVALLLGASTGMATRGRRLVALTVALLWAIHPIQVSSVLYVVQRMETLAATFMLAALICYLQGRLRQVQGTRAWTWILAAGLLTLTGLLSKETAVLVPVYALAMELTVLRFAAANPRVRHGWRVLYAAMVVIAVVVFVALVIPRYWTGHYVARSFGTAERLLTQLRILPMYLQQILLPTPGTLVFYYDNVLPSRGLLQPMTTMLGGLLLSILVALAAWLRRRAPLFALGVMWFMVSHLLTSNVIGLELVFEHRNYLALLGVLLVLCDLGLRLPAASRQFVVPATAAAIVVACMGLTLIRSATWGDPLLLATELAVENRSSARASADLAARYSEMSDGYATSPFVDMAIAEFQRGAGLPGASIISDQGLILIAAHNGRPVPAAWWDRLIGKVRNGALSPETTGALFSLLDNRYKGVPLDDAKLLEAFAALFDRTLMPPYSYAQVGDFAMVHAQNPLFADQMFVRAVEASAGQPDYARKVVDTLDEKGWHRQAALARAKAKAMQMPGFGTSPDAASGD